jgi:hypothetical protein
MFLNIPKQNKPLFFASKSRLTFQKNIRKDKAQMMAFIEKTKNIQPKKKNLKVLKLFKDDKNRPD